MDLDAESLTSVKENLELLEALLLEGESALRVGEDPFRLIQPMFRYAHNAKGALAMLAIDPCIKVIHHLETGLDAIRKSQAVLTSRHIDAYLASVAAVSAFLADHATEEALAVWEETLEELNLSSKPSSTELTAQSGELKARIDVEIAKGRYVYELIKTLDANLDRATFDVLPIFSDIARLGELLQSSPPWEEFKSHAPEVSFQVLFSSDLDSDALSYEIFDVFRVIASPKTSHSTPASVPSSMPVAASTEPKTRILMNDAGADGSARFLVVEDDLVSRTTLTRSLEEYGRCDIAVNGTEGLVLFVSSLQEGHPYDIIFLDIMMPELDGAKLLRLIRKAEEDYGKGGYERTQIVMFSSLGDSKSVLGSFKDGCEAYLVKPLDRGKLREVLGKLGVTSLPR